MSVTRRLAALMFTDMVGYSALAHVDERKARELVDEQRELVRDAVKRHRGWEHQHTGDGFFLEFASVVEALECAVEIQTALHERERVAVSDRPIRIRVGIHLGDVMIRDNDVYGDGVNIAARIEALAPPGGICITRPVRDLVDGKIEGVRLRSMGRRRLKNIEGGAELYRVVLPWESRVPRLPRLWRRAYGAERPRLGGALLATLFAGALATLFAAGTAALRKDGAAPATADAARIDLVQGWSFRLQEDAPNAWRAYDAIRAARQADLLRGRHALRNVFRADTVPAHPALVFGVVGGAYRVYLNDRFIGGGDDPTDVAAFAFDAALLHAGAENTLRIDAEPGASVRPGLTVFPELGAYVGDFDAVSRAVRANRLRYNQLPNVYFATCLMIFLASFALALARRPAAAYAYCSLVLLLGSLSLAFYAPWARAALGPGFQHFLRVLALTQAPLMLLSAFLHRKGLHRAEELNNALALALAVGGGVALLAGARSHAAYADAGAWVGLAGFFQGAIALAGLGIHALRGRSALAGRGVPGARRTARLDVAQLGAVATGLAIALPLLESAATGISLPVGVRNELIRLSLVSPFAFALACILSATLDYIRQSRASRTGARRDELMLEVIRLAHATDTPAQAISAIQERMCGFLSATRSTLFVFASDDNDNGDGNGSDACLKAAHAVGMPPDSTVFRRAGFPRQGPVGYVVQTRRPLLIDDIRSDARFFGPAAQHTVEPHASYRSGSCMILPLLSGHRLVGVLTFADRADGAPFDLGGLTLAHEICASLGLLLDNQRMRDALRPADARAA